MSIAKPIKNFLLALFTLWLLIPPHSVAQETSQQSEMRLSLQECVRLALENNLDILNERINPQKNSAQIIQQEAVFDPSMTFDLSKEVQENRGTSTLSGGTVIRQENLLANMGIKKKLKSGATVEMDFDNKQFHSNSYFSSINPYYESNLIFKLTQPLLENRGQEINEAQITVAVNNREVSLLKLKQKMIDIISNTQTSYWEIVYSKRFLEVKQMLVKQAQNLLEINKTKVSVGSLPQFGIEILDAESSIASRQADVLAAQDSLKDAEDKLRKLINHLEDEHANIVPLDNPSTAENEPAFAENIQAALNSRPDYLSLQKGLHTEKINLTVADNERLPDLKLVGQWGINGLGSSYGDNLDHLSNLNYRTWLVGINLEIPWGKRLDNSRYMESKLNLEQKELALKNLAQQITLEVREAVRQVKTNRQRIQAGQIAQTLEEKKLAVAEEKYRLGEKSFTTHDVLDYQTQLAQARINLLRATIDFNNSLINLYVKRGTLLEDNKIKTASLFPES